MLSCSGHNNRDITMGADIFDAARIGGDIFQWEEFISQCVARVMKYYAYHNVMFYNDPDNIVLRPKFNTFDQALSRLSFNALLGLPLTLGDHLPDLPEERIELLKRGLPPLDAHPMDIRESIHNYQVIKLNLAIERPYESWNVVDLLNLRHESSDVLLDLKTDLHLSDGVYLVYDYWEKTYIGEFESTIPLQLRPCASKVLAVRKKLNHPQLLSTSRHVSQGAVDLESLAWDGNLGVLSAVSHVIKDDPYIVTLYVPAALRPFTEGNRTSMPEFIHIGGNIWQFTIQPNETGDVAWSVDFSEKNPA